MTKTAKTHVLPLGLPAALLVPLLPCLLVSLASGLRLRKGEGEDEGAMPLASGNSKAGRSKRQEGTKVRFE